MTNDMDENLKQELLSEKAQIELDLGDYAVFDPETNKWVAVPENMNTNETDDNDKADRSEEYELRSAKVDAMQNRLNDITAKLSSIK